MAPSMRFVLPERPPLIPWGIPGRVLAMVGIVGLSLTAACAARPPERPQTGVLGRFDYVEAYASWLIEKEMADHKTVGLSVALVDDQRMVWARGFGFSDREARVAASADTLYRIGSISKLFTVTAAMQLAEGGLLDIDRPLHDYLPEFSVRSRFPDASPITLRLLMTHHSGLPSDRFKGMWTANPEPLSDLAGELADTYVSAPPNTVFSYSNLGFSLLGAAVERAAGRPFAELLRESVFVPFGMTSSFASTRFDGKGYREGHGAPELALRDVPAGGVVSSAADLARFMETLFAGGVRDGRVVVSPASLEESWRPQNASVVLDLGLRVGLGWALNRHGMSRAERVASHGGATLAFESGLVVLPDRKLGVVVLANTPRAGCERLAVEILKVALEAKAGIAPPRPPPSDERLAAPGTIDVEPYAGRWATPFGILRITNAGGELGVELKGKSARLLPTADGWMRFERRFLGIFRVSAGDLDALRIRRAVVSGREILVSRSSREGTSPEESERVFAEKIRVVPIPPAWLARLGTYQVVDRGDDVPIVDSLRLGVHDGVLVASFTIAGSDEEIRSALEPRSDDEATRWGIGRYLGETVRALTVGDRRLLEYAGLRLARVP